MDPQTPPLVANPPVVPNPPAVTIGPLVRNPPLVKNPFPPDSLAEVQIMVDGLCRELKLAQGFVDIQEVKKGNKHSVVLFTWVLITPMKDLDRFPLVLRTPSMTVPIPGAWNHVQVQRMAAINFIFRRKGLNLPAIFSYDSSYHNHIKCPYIIQQQLEGQTLAEHYRRLSSHSDAKDYDFGRHISQHIVTQEAKFRAKHYGTFQIEEDMTLKSIVLDRVEDQIGVHVRSFIPGPPMAAHSKTIDFICNILSFQENQLRNPAQEEKFRKLRHIALCIYLLEDDGEGKHPAHRPEPSILWHPSFYPNKIMCTSQALYYNPENGLSEPDKNIPPQYERKPMGQNITLTGILGYDGCMALPRVMTRCPPSFLWEEGPQIPREHRLKIVKANFDAMMEEKLPGYCADAYGFMPKIVRALGFYTIFGVDFVWPELPFDRLVEEWEAYSPESQSLEW